MAKKKSYWTLRYWEDNAKFEVYANKKVALKHWLNSQLVRITIEELK